MILYGKQVLEHEKDKIEEKIKSISKKLKLVILTVGEDAASSVYVRNKIKLCNELGIEAINHRFSQDISEKVLLSEIYALNNDSSVDAILVQLPIPKHISEHKIIQAISPLKDVDGFTDQNIVKLYLNDNPLVPCTVQGIQDMLDYYDVKYEGKNVVIAGRSNIVGKPLSLLFTNYNATVTLCHSKTKDMKEHIKNADIFISAIGSPNFFTKEYFINKSELTVIDVGINRVDSKLCGDVDFENVKDIVKNITPVPKGVGVLTVLNVVKNVIKCYELRSLNGKN